MTALLAGCGGEPASPPGSAGNPMQAHPSSTGRDSAREPGSASTVTPGYESLVTRQSRRPGRRFSPCSLVTREQASAIVGQAVRLPYEAPQGPTCVYRTVKGSGLVTVAVQRADFATAKRNLRQATEVGLGSRTGLCGQYGQPTLYAPLTHGRMLMVAAPCQLAKKFAARAVRTLSR